MAKETHESAARQRWRLVRTVFFEDDPVQPAMPHFKKPKRSAARARWSLVRRTFEIDASKGMQQAQMPSSEVEMDSRQTVDATLEVKTSAVDEEVDKITREPSLTAVDSPYRSALVTLADLDWQFYDSDGRESPSMPTMPQHSMVHYHPNHEAFFDEVSGHPVPKISTRSFKGPAASYFGRTGLADVREDIPKKPSVHDFYARKRKIPSFRLRNMRFTIAQTLARYLRSCTRPDAKV